VEATGAEDMGKGVEALDAILDPDPPGVESALMGAPKLGPPTAEDAPGREGPPREGPKEGPPGKGVVGPRAGPAAWIAANEIEGPPGALIEDAAELGMEGPNELKSGNSVADCANCAAC